MIITLVIATYLCVLIFTNDDASRLDKLEKAHMLLEKAHMLDDSEDRALENRVQALTTLLENHLADEEIPLTDATGGNVVQEDGDYKYHIFNSNGTFTVTQGGTNVDFLVIGGGGAGGKAPFTGDRITGGGGAGGYRTSYGTSGGNSQAEAPLALSPGNYDVVVGAGGDASASTDESASETFAYTGKDSSFNIIISLGGGYGGYDSDSKRNGGDGGSGGGAAGQQAGANAGEGTSNQGFHGYRSESSRAGGGGGAGGGSQGTGSDEDGGVGLASSITGTAIYRGGGGGAGRLDDYPPGGNGGGGAGAYNNHGNDGAANTGGGGGGTRNLTSTNYYGGNGGSGVVILRYRFQ